MYPNPFSTKKFSARSPIEYALSILHVSDDLPQYVAIACGFWFDDPMCWDPQTHIYVMT